MNKLILHGRLAKDPEKRDYKDKTITAITVAVDRGYGENKTADFIPATAFGKTAELLQKYFVKGSEIVLVGEVQNNNYEKEDGTRVYGLKVVIREVEFAGSKKQKEQGDVPSDLSEFEEINDLNLPF